MQSVAANADWVAPSSRKPLWLFIALSVAVHLLVLLAWKVEPQKWGSDAPVLELRLIENDPSENLTSRVAAATSAKPAAPARIAPVPQPHEAAATPPNAKQSAEVEAIVEANSEHVAISEPTPAAPQPGGATTSPEPAAAVPTLSRDELLQRIQRRLALLKQYPALARRRGWEGDVHLTFGVNEHGAIGAIKVAISSGFQLLDDNAVAALRQIDQLLVDEETVDATDRLDLAVRYRLIDG